MRTDVKVGLVVGAIIGVGILGYVFLSRTGQPASHEGRVSVVGEERPPAPSPELERPAPSPTGETIEIGLPAPVRETPAPVRETPAPVRETPAPIEPPTHEGPTPIRPPVVVTVPVEPRGETPPPSTPSSYVVQQGDKGYWSIAQKVYGDGSKYELIAKANPAYDSNSLRPGVKLVIPPLPRPAAVPPVGPAAPSPAALAGGGTTYVVQQGDAGLWTIAEKFYKDGSKWHLIEKANPGVDTNRLRPGTRLVIPKLEGVELPTSAPVGPAPSTSPAAASGRPAAPARAATGERAPADDGRPRFYD